MPPRRARASVSTSGFAGFQFPLEMITVAVRPWGLGGGNAAGTQAEHHVVEGAEVGEELTPTITESLRDQPQS